MAGKKKTNYIVYELQKLELYFQQLEAFLDKNPPDLAVDRTEVFETRTGTGIKVIASIEDQVKMFLTALEKLPKILEDLNRLRAVVDGKEAVEIRGGSERPGFMDDDDEEEEEKVKKKSNKKKKDDSVNAFDDDSFYSEAPSSEQKLLPVPDESDDEGDDDWMDND